LEFTGSKASGGKKPNPHTLQNNKQTNKQKTVIKRPLLESLFLLSPPRELAQTEVKKCTAPFVPIVLPSQTSSAISRHGALQSPAMYFAA